ncbi:MAG: hypothetical protein JWM21_1844 [Acidobacteria bacterium]|nr:hypothetical protein [Acidobacteriota bacterium]
MKTATYRCQSFVLTTALFVGTVAVVWPQSGNQNSEGPAGGKTSDSAAEKKVTTPKPVRTTTPKPGRNTPPPSKTTGKSPAQVVADIDGKWWTTGNDFGTSQLLLEQNGSLVSGAIQYADGRTGTFSGVIAGKRINYTWTNSSGDRGTGWLEQSWNNFLGGSYRDQKGATGSWTLNRIAGNWCFGGSRERLRKVNHSSKGQLFYVTEDGGEEAGHLEGPWIFLHGELSDVKGTMNYKGNRVEFETGTFWTWCGR